MTEAFAGTKYWSEVMYIWMKQKYTNDQQKTKWDKFPSKTASDTNKSDIGEQY